MWHVAGLAWFMRFQTSDECSCSEAANVLFPDPGAPTRMIPIGRVWPSPGGSDGAGCPSAPWLPLCLCAFPR